MFKRFKWCMGGGGDSPPRSSAAESSSAGAGGSGGLEGVNGLIWYRDNERHCCGSYSMAMVQANKVLEDQCQVVCGPFGTFVGIYDGHGGHQAAHYVRDHLYQNLLEISAESQGTITEDIITTAIQRTEYGFTQQVAELWNNNDNNAAAMATTGTCCLIGVIYNKTLFVANLGDSRAVLCSRFLHLYTPLKISHGHNVNCENVRSQLQRSHRDHEVVQKRNGVYRVKGILQVCGSIGDLFLKYEQYNQQPIPDEFRVQGRRHFPYLTADPKIDTYNLSSGDLFVIFASDGLWDCLTKDQAAKVVRESPKAESAKKLVGAALNKKRSSRVPAALEDIPKGDRRNYIDDMSVVVLWLDHNAVSRGAVFDQPISVQGPESIS